MKKSLIALAALSALGCVSQVVRARTHDVAFTYRMGAGFPGDVNRTHPASIVPGLMDTNDPITAYGRPALFDATDNTYRAMLATDDSVTKIAGILVRPLSSQQTTGGMTATIGAATPPTSGVVDVLRQGFMMVLCTDFAAHAPVKGGDVFVWTAASSGNHVVGGFEAYDTSGSCAAIANARFNGPPDSTGVCEIEVWAA